jgi:hypothetical protein
MHHVFTTVLVPLIAQIEIDLGNLDITTDVVNFDEIDDDLERFQQDEIVREALEKVSRLCCAEGARCARRAMLSCCVWKTVRSRAVRASTCGTILVKLKRILQLLKKSLFLTVRQRPRVIASLSRFMLRWCVQMFGRVTTSRSCSIKSRRAKQF